MKKGLHTFNKKEMVALLIANNQNPKSGNAHYSNDLLLAMLEYVADNFTAKLEETKGGFPFNRGSAAECLIRAIITGEMHNDKAQAKEADLFLKKETLGLPARVKIEIKFSTSYSNASVKRSRGKYVVIVGKAGAFMVESKYLITTASGTINLNKQNAKYCHRLDELSQALGL